MSADLAPTIGADEARERLARVRAHVEQAGTDLTALYQGRAWLALGHDSWESLCDAELGGVRIALPRAERREVVAGMREAGLSTRAIGAAIGASEATVRRDLGASYDAPEGQAEARAAYLANGGDVLGRDGKIYPAYPAKVTTTEKVERHVDLDTGEIVADPYAAGVAAADAVVLPRLPRDYERERLVKQNGNLAHALETFAGMADPVARARYAREWDPDACDAYPHHFTPDTIRDVANGLLAFADELESSRGLRVV